MSHQPLVTVVIPNFNHEHFLKQRIESVLNQSFQDFELYIFDDCSTDNSLAVINQFETHSKVKSILINNTNSGSLFKQWVKAIELASGKYLWIAESDDFADIDFLKETVSIAEKNQKSGLIFTDSIIVNELGDFIEKVSTSNNIFSGFNDQDFYEIKDRSKVLNYFVSNLIIWNASSVLFRKNAITEVDFNVLSTLKNAGDLFTYISIALKHDIVYVNQPLNYYRSHDFNTTKKNVVSGVLFSDRQTVMAYFIKELHELQGSKSHLMSFFKRNFLTAVDFRLYNKVNKLLKAYYTNKIISLYPYLHLSLYVCYSRVFIKIPNKYRSYIKKVLAK